MAIMKSTGLRNHLLVTGSLKGALDGGCIRIYSGAVPANADASIGSAVLLVTLTNDATGTGITLDSTASSGSVTKNPAEIWRGINVATGTATFFRFGTLADTNAASTTEKRIQGTLGTSGADMNVSSVSLVSTASQSLSHATFSVSM